MVCDRRSGVSERDYMECLRVSGDSIVVAHPQTGRDVEGVVPAGVGPGQRFQVFVG